MVGRPASPGPFPRRADPVLRTGLLVLRSRYRQPRARQRPVLHDRGAPGPGQRPGYLVAADHQPAGDRHPRHHRQGVRRCTALLDAGQDGTRQHQHTAVVPDGAGDPQQLHPGPPRHVHTVLGVLHRPRSWPDPGGRPPVRTGCLVLAQAQSQHGGPRDRRHTTARRLPLAEPGTDPRAEPLRPSHQHGRPHGAVVHALPAAGRVPAAHRGPLP